MFSTWVARSLPANWDLKCFFSPVLWLTVLCCKISGPSCPFSLRWSALSLMPTFRASRVACTVGSYVGMAHCCTRVSAGALPVHRAGAALWPQSRPVLGGLLAFLHSWNLPVPTLCTKGKGEHKVAEGILEQRGRRKCWVDTPTGVCGTYSSLEKQNRREFVISEYKPI